MKKKKKKPVAKKADDEEDEEEEFEEPEPELPEPPLTETLSDYRAQLSGATKARRGAGIFTLLLCVMAVLEHFSILPEAYTADPMIRALPPLAVEAIVCAIGWRAALAQTGKSHVGLFDDASMPCHAARYGTLCFSSRARGAVAAAAGAGGDVGLLRAAGRKPASARHV